MIPNFKTYINESVWSDIHKRSNGETIRKEDDIELLDMFGLYEYILDHYELTDKRFEMTYGTENMAIYVSKFGDEIMLTYKFGEVHCFFNLSKPLYIELSKLFYIKRAEENHYIIFPKKDVTNKFYIDVLDCIIANKPACILKRKEKVSESVWSDIHKRSNGTSTRKEDDIDLMSFEELYNYIQDKYLLKYDNAILLDEKEGRIVIDLYEVSGGRNCYLSLNDLNGEKYIALSDLYTKHMRDLLDGYYHIGERSFANSSLDDFIIRPKDDGEITNKFFIELLDFLIDNADSKHQPNLYPANKFRKNESVWSDIHRRSNGSQGRKEDDINKLDFDDFFEYLKDIYVRIKPSSFWAIGKYDEPGMEGEVQTISFPVESSAMGSIAIKKNVKTNTFYPIKMKHKFLEQYETDLYNTFYLTKDAAKLSGYIINKNTCDIFPHNGHITNEICIDVIDKLLGIVERPIFKKVE
jgi:hypothetical protein